MKKTAKKLLALLLACILIASLVSCGKTENPGATPDASADPGATPGAAPETADGAGNPAAPDRTLNVTVTQDPGSLDPKAVSSNDFLAVVRTFYDVLLEYKADSSVEYVLATGLDSVSDIQYTMHLREGVTFANGNPFTAADVLFSMNLCLSDPKLTLQVKAIDFDKTKILDEYTIDLWLTHYDVTQFPSLNLLYIFDEESYDEQDIAVNPNGTGPYTVTGYVINSYLTVEARDGYWGAAPGIKSIRFTVMDEDSQRVNAVETGDTDVAGIPLKDVDYISSLGTHNVITPPGSSAATAYFNCTPEGAPLSAVAAREAVMHAIDRQSIVDLVFSGKSSVPSWPVSDNCIDAESRFANMDETYSIGYDPVKAKALAEQEGLVGQKLRIITNGAQEYVTMAEIIQSGLQAIGVSSEITNYDMATYMSIIGDPSNFDIALFLTGSSSSLGVDMLANFPLFIPLGWTGADHDSYLQTGQEANSTADDAARSDKLNEMLKIFYASQPWYALAENVNTVAYSKDLTGIEYYLSGGIRFHHWSFAG
jgi:peptide/nickel transport system substrate-binding protein